VAGRLGELLFSKRQAALRPFLLHAERKVLRALPCRPLAFAWSEHAFETAFLASEVAAGAGCVAAGFAVGADCAMAAFAPIRTTKADNINVFENLIATSLNAGAAAHCHASTVAHTSTDAAAVQRLLRGSCSRLTSASRPRTQMKDGGTGPQSAFAAVWDSVPIQRCTVHKHRNLLAHGPERAIGRP
jgi:hypothetical protein